MIYIPYRDQLSIPLADAAQFIKEAEYKVILVESSPYNASTINTNPHNVRRNP